MTTTLAPTPTDVKPPKPPKARGKLGDRVLFAYTWAIILWLCLPIVVMIAFGFNNVPGTGKLNYTWHGFTLKWYRHLFDDPALGSSIKASIIIAVVATIIATALGTLIGLALGKYRFKGQGAANLVQFAAISAPEIVMGSSLIAFFVQSGIALGYTTIIIAHVMFSLSFVAITVRSRVITLDPSMDEAARDLGAGPWTTFRLVTLPMIFPGVMAGALLAFALSIDDFIITNFTAGKVQTFPLWIWATEKQGVPPQVNVMGTLIFTLGILFAVFNAVMSRRRDA
jgi:spermidine/putrescine transport system permease protein